MAHRHRTSRSTRIARGLLMGRSRIRLPRSTRRKNVKSMRSFVLTSSLTACYIPVADKEGVVIDEGSCHVLSVKPGSLVNCLTDDAKIGGTTLQSKPPGARTLPSEICRTISTQHSRPRVSERCGNSPRSINRHLRSIRSFHQRM
jgi:hypothetical protein